MDFDIFKNDSEREDAKMRLPELIQHPGWKYICRVLDKNFEFVDQELDTRRDFETVDSIYTLLDRRNDLRKLKETPTLLLKELQQNQPGQESEDESVYDEPGEDQPSN
jgi:hypothetical protein